MKNTEQLKKTDLISEILEETKASLNPLKAEVEAKESENNWKFESEKGWGRKWVNEVSQAEGLKYYNDHPEHGDRCRELVKFIWTSLIDSIKEICGDSITKVFKPLFNNMVDSFGRDKKFISIFFDISLDGAAVKFNFTESNVVKAIDYLKESNNANIKLLLKNLKSNEKLNNLVSQKSSDLLHNFLNQKNRYKEYGFEKSDVYTVLRDIVDKMQIKLKDKGYVTYWYDGYSCFERSFYVYQILFIRINKIS